MTDTTEKVTERASAEGPRKRTIFRRLRDCIGRNTITLFLLVALLMYLSGFMLYLFKDQIHCHDIEGISGCELASIPLMLLSLLCFFYALPIERALFETGWFFRLHAEKAVAKTEAQIRILSGNESAVLSDEHKATVRLSARPQRDRIKSFSTLALVLLPVPPAVTEWISQHVGKVETGIPLTLLVSAAVAPLIAGALGAYTIRYSPDNNVLLKELYKEYISEQPKSESTDQQE